MSSATPIDLSRLPPPEVVEVLDYETIFEERKARLIALYPPEQRAEVAAALTLESEPMVKLLQENTYREMLWRQRVNDAARATQLAFAMDGDLDHLAALFEVGRLTIAEADPATDAPAVMESNEDLRRRTQLAPQGFSVAGPEGAYRKHALDASGLVLDASASSPAPCEVVVTVLARVGDGTADEALLDTVTRALSANDVRPLADFVQVRSATILRYAARATLTFFAGPDRALVREEALRRTRAYTRDMHRLGMAITLDGLYAAMRAPGVQKVTLIAPTADIAVSRQQAAYCTGVELLDGGLYA